MPRRQQPALIAEGGRIVATFDADRVFDYRARRPTLEIVDGRLAELDWPEFRIRLVRVGERDLLVLDRPRAGLPLAEPGRSRQSRCAVALGVTEWISLGAIPAAVPHTRPVPILGTVVEAGPPPRRHPTGPGRPAPRAGGAGQRPRDARVPGRHRRPSATSPRCPITSAARTPRQPWSC